MVRESVAYLEDMDAMEPFCTAVRVRSVIVYCYPPTEKVLMQRPKVMLADGRVVKNVQIARRNGEKVIVGVLDGETLVWDIGGRLCGGAEGDVKSRLLVPERYFDRHWRDKIKVSNGEWAVRWQRPHPSVALPQDIIMEI